MSLSDSLPVPPCRYVIFDAVGTLISPQPDVASVYHSIGRKYGSQRARDAIAASFQQLMQNRVVDVQTSEALERQFWKETVAEVLGPIQDDDGCFHELYEHFANPESWTIPVAAQRLLHQLQCAEVPVGVASNFDARLHRVLDGHQILRSITPRLISSEIGWRKPDRRFYHRLIQQVGLPPQQILMVGDDERNDIRPAAELGLQTVRIGENISPVSPEDCSHGERQSANVFQARDDGWHKVLLLCGLTDAE